MNLANHAYLNITVPNPRGSGRVVEARYNQEQSQPILRRIQDYKVHVARFKIPSGNVPIFRPVQTPDFYQIGFHWVSSAQTTVPVVVSLDLSQNTEILHYSSFLQVVNDSIIDAWRTFVNDANNSPDVLRLNPETETKPPMFSADNQRIRFTAYVVEDATSTPVNNVFNTDTSTRTNEDVRIAMNDNLRQYFLGFAFEAIPNDLVVLAQVAPVQRPLQPSQDIYEDWSSLAKWNDITRIVIKTNVPLHKEIILASEEGSPVKVSDHILTDYQFVETTEQTDFVFAPSGEKRWSSFASTGDITRFDIQAFYQTKDLQQFPLTIPQGGEFNCKLEFQKVVQPVVISEHQ